MIVRHSNTVEISSEAIYSSLPENIIEKDLSPKYDALREKLLLHLVTHKGEIFGAKKLCENIGYPSGGTQVQLRKHITELIELWHQPIISTSKGFGMAVYPNQMRVSIEHDEQRIQGLQRRINSKKEILKTMEKDFNEKNPPKPYVTELETR